MMSTTTTVCETHEQQYGALLVDLSRSFSELTNDPKTKLFTTDADGLFDAYLNALPSDRQYHTCHCCRNFIDRFGGLVAIDEQGSTQPIMWALYVDGFYGPALAAMATRVRAAKVTGVFYSKETTWGQPVTGPWTHFSVAPPAHLIHKERIKTAYQASAEKLEDYKTMITTLQEFALPIVETAITLLKTDSLYRSEKCLGVAKWLRDLIVARNATKNSKTRANLLWRAVAAAPAGFAHPRSSMIGTLLEDIAAGLPFDDVKAKFAAKMHPLQYQRPQVAPTAGAIAVAEKIVEQMGIARSLERRFARLDEIETLWKPAETAKESQSGGVFSHLQPKDVQRANAAISAIGATMTWEKFARTVLPDAERMEIAIPSRGNFAAYVTAEHADASPILQWDREDRRNPVSWYLYHGGSFASRWGLSSGAWARVNAVSAQPNQWHGSHDHQGAGVLFVIDGAKDNESRGNALFPECLKSELHSVRSVIESYSRSASMGGLEQASACGLIIQKSSTSPVRIRVTVKEATIEYMIDRWD